MNKEQVQKLIERLADKTLSVGSIVETDVCGKRKNLLIVKKELDDEWIAYDKSEQTFLALRKHIPNTTDKILGHPLYIGDVLEKIANRYHDDPGTRYELNECDMQVLLKLWTCFPLNSSLQTILDEAEWKVERRCEICDTNIDKLPKGSRAIHTGECKDFPIFIETTLKYPTLELFQFLETLFPNNNPNDTTNAEN